MRIIKMGKIPTSEAECELCKSVLEYTPLDVKLMYPTDEAVNAYGAEAIPMRYIICPVCTTKIWV